MPEKKINLEEIWLNSVTKFENIDGSTVWSIGEDAMLEFGKQLLELAAENAELVFIGECDSDGMDINKQSILDTINQVE